MIIRYLDSFILFYFILYYIFYITITISILIAILLLPIIITLIYNASTLYFPILIYLPLPYSTSLLSPSLHSIYPYYYTTLTLSTPRTYLSRAPSLLLSPSTSCPCLVASCVASSSCYFVVSRVTVL